jgi:hypothetical protein
MYTILPSGVIEMPITPDMLAEAEADANDMGRLKHSSRKGEGNVVGFLGEIAFARYLGAERCNTYDYDLIWLGNKVDVKAKERGYPVKLWRDDASVARYNANQKADFYGFASVLETAPRVYTKVELIGFYPCNIYKRDAVEWFKGDVDHSNNWHCTMDCYNLRYDRLEKLAPSSYFG